MAHIRECFTGQKVTNATLGWVGSFLAQSYYRGWVGGWGLIFNY